jgi:outer membrane immunogenic protein
LVLDDRKIIDRTVTVAQQTTPFETARLLKMERKKEAIMRGVLLWTTVVCMIVLRAPAALSADAAVVVGGPPPYGPPPFIADTAVPTLFYFWNGPYLGLQGGWGWTSTKGLNASGDFGGGQVGYNYQTGNFVLGLEADGSFADIASHEVTIPVIGLPPGSVGYREDGLASVRARFGVAMNGLLFYGTAGGGWIHSKGSTLLGVTVSEQSWRGGYAAGAGVEWGFLPNWSAKVEYLHFGVGSTRYFDVFNTGNVNVETFKIGVNYLFR